VAQAQAIVLSRTYPTAVGVPVNGFVVINFATTNNSNTYINYWLNGWTGTTTTTTGFTLNLISPTAQNRTVFWRFIPSL
jgi:hypothetical protein